MRADIPFFIGAMLNHPQREASPSPTLRDRDRPRASKTQSMPLVPSLTAFPPQPPQPQNAQASPVVPNNPARRSSPIGQITRLLPTPPHNNPPSFEQEPRLSPLSGPQQTMNGGNPNQHYSRPGPRAPVATFPNRLQNLDENWQMTPQLLADIELADQQQAQYQAGQPPNVERIRATAERSSPINPDNNQQRGRRDQQILRESPKSRDRHPASPMGPSFEAALTPEKRASPSPLGPEPHPNNYAAHYNTRESPPVHRRIPAGDQRLNASVPNPAPPQAIATRMPDRSLPVQEEDENGSHSRTEWQDNDTMVESEFNSSSPHNADLKADGAAQRFETNKQAPHHDEEKIHNHDEDRSQYANRDSTEEEGGHTPRSPTVCLPDDNHESYHPGSNVPIRAPAPVPLRPKGRNGPSDQIMRGLDSTLMDNKPLQAPPAVPQPPQTQSSQFAEQRPPAQPQPIHGQYHKYTSPQDYAYANHLVRDRSGRYVPAQPQVYPDDFQNYDDDLNSAYIQAYLPSPRPDAPVPPTPHSATAAPSPSPMHSDYGIPKPTGTPGYRPPHRSVGSPYPFPFNHVRRNRQNQNSRLIANGLDPATITEQIARQWQIFAQNNQGNITESTLSPSSTPFQPDLFDHWAYLHTNRMMRNLQDTASITSSPSHQPVPLPLAPHFGSRKKDKALHSKRQAYSRKPPPRVDSTQPRETSPELSSSGEETAGDDRVNPTPDISASNTENEQGITIAVEVPIENADADDSGEWVDDEEDDDYDDVIDLEYHPSFVRNVSKRRRKWEVGWEHLIQAVSR